MPSDVVKTILVVEDQQDVQQLLLLALSGPGRCILQALDAEAAEHLIFSERPDLVLLDIMMPGRMDGIDLLRKVRADEATRHIKVLILSARAQSHDRKEAFDAGADGYLVKPFRLNELKRCVAECLALGLR